MRTILLLTLLFLISCKKDEKLNPGDPEYSLSAKVWLTAVEPMEPGDYIVFNSWVDFNDSTLNIFREDHYDITDTIYLNCNDFTYYYFSLYRRNDPDKLQEVHVEITGYHNISIDTVAAIYDYKFFP